jgi:hypothetical protein
VVVTKQISLPKQPSGSGASDIFKPVNLYLNSGPDRLHHIFQTVFIAFLEHIRHFTHRAHDTQEFPVNVFGDFPKTCDFIRYLIVFIAHFLPPGGQLVVAP